ncbi:MAG: hypothetical protein IJO61_04570 [Oscillospiraceae bacterium]|nr:hypothetical protein [Oscillospiraceae bacterium]
MSELEKRYIEVSNLPHFEISCSDGNKYVLLPVEHLSDIPSADVEEVVHGKWIGDKNKQVNCSHLFHYDDWCCSICGLYYPERNYERLGKHCPYCGAKMDGETYHEQVEVCPYCDKENTFPMWNTEEQGFIATCQHCGEEIFLCDACQHTVCEDGEPHNCDWRETDCGGKCHRGETTRKEFK